MPDAPAGLPVKKPLHVRLLMSVPLLNEAVFRLIGKSSLKGFFNSGVLPGTSDHWGAAERAHYFERVENEPALLRSLFSTLQNFSMNHEAPVFERIGQHPRKVLLFWGELDATCPFENAATLLQLLPRAELASFSTQATLFYLTTTKNALQS